MAKSDDAADAACPVPVAKRDGGGWVLGVILWPIFGGAGATTGVFGWGAKGPASVDGPAVGTAKLSFCFTAGFERVSRGRINRNSDKKSRRNSVDREPSGTCPDSTCASVYQRRCDAGGGENDQDELKTRKRLNS